MTQPAISGLCIFGVFASVLDEIAEAQRHEPDAIGYLQPATPKAFTRLRDDPPSSSAPQRIYLTTSQSPSLVAYEGTLVGWRDKRTLSEEEAARIEAEMGRLQPGEGGLDRAPRGSGAAPVNLLLVRDLRKLDAPYPNDVLLNDVGVPLGLKGMGGGIAYVGASPELRLPRGAVEPGGINAYFRHRLEAKVAMPRGSWGAVDSYRQRVFLRVWHDEFRPGVGASLHVPIFRDTGDTRPGHRERARHVALIQAGYAGFGVRCLRREPGLGQISGFERDWILPFAALFEQGGAVWAVVHSPVRIDEIHRDPQATYPMEVAAHSPETTREAIVQARIGQDRFRAALRQRWKDKCAVSGIDVPVVLRASHCVPWREAADPERRDPDNGLLLSATLDALFDAWLISFTSEGEMLVSLTLSVGQRQALGVPRSLSCVPSPAQDHYLAQHRTRFHELETDRERAERK